MSPTASAPARTTSVLLGLTAAATAVALAVPAARPGVALLATWAAPVLFAAGVLRHRPAQLRPWLVLVVMLTTWTAAATLGVTAGHDHPAVRPLMLVGQVLGCLAVAGVGLGLVRGRRGDAAARTDAVSSVLVVGAVLTLVAVQLSAAGQMTPGFVAVASVDVVLLGVVVRFTVARTGLLPASLLLLAGGSLAIAYDLATALRGERLAAEGSASQVLGSACVLVIAAAAQHPSMVRSFTPQDFHERRRASLALLGLLPLLLSPALLAVVVAATGRPAPPAWFVACACTVVAALCLRTATQALRASEHLASHDPLTDLANRRGLAQLHHGDRSLDCLLLLDVDEFKQVNDTHGHEVGDRLLVEVGTRLRRSTAGEGVVARLGGDEFVVLTSHPVLDDVAARVLAAFDVPFPVEGRPVRVGASIGVSTGGTPGPDGRTPLEDLLVQADIAMYAAKRSGGHRVRLFHPDMRQEVTRRYALGDDVRRLLAGEHPDVGRLEVHYQPVVDMATGATVAAEALVRWRHPARGLLGPGDFLDLVNGNDLDALLDSAVVRGVCADLRHWRDQGRAVVPVSVNLTRDSLDDPDLAPRLLAALAQADLPTDLFRVEITEHEQLSDAGPAAASLRVLRDAGVAVLLDDYGTGYTSLDYLRRFPVQVLKLDRSLVRTVVGDDGDGAALLAAVTAMSDSLALDVVAEGVETPAQRDALLALGVHRAQGFLFARPLTADAFADGHLGAPVLTPR